MFHDVSENNRSIASPTTPASPEPDHLPACSEQANEEPADAGSAEPMKRWRLTACEHAREHLGTWRRGTFNYRVRRVWWAPWLMEVNLLCDTCWTRWQGTR